MFRSGDRWMHASDLSHIKWSDAYWVVGEGESSLAWVNNCDRLRRILVTRLSEVLYVSRQ